MCVIAASLVPANPLHAATWTVDIETSRPADFRTIQEAVDAASDGDTILVAGSNTPYPAATISKRVAIKGPGHSNFHPLSASAKALGLNFTSVGVVNEQQASVEGMVISSLTTTNFCTGFRISRCHGGTTLKSGVLTEWFILGANSLVQNCFYDPSPTGKLEIRGSNTLIIGSIINGLTIGLVSGEPIAINIRIDQCTLGEFSADGRFTDRGNPSITNTIIMENFANRTRVLLGNYEHCMAIGTVTIPAGNGNINLPNVSGLFTNQIWYELGIQSPARGSGIDGGDMGAYDGISPFVIGLRPALPRITELRVPAVVPDSAGLTFEISAEALK